MTRFAIITFRDKGPLKNWQAVRAGNVHNARTQRCCQSNAKRSLHDAFGSLRACA